MRVQLSSAEEAGAFSNKLLDVGNGILVGGQDGLVTLPFGNSIHEIQELMSRVFLDMGNKFKDHNWLRMRAILAPKNDAVDNRNLQLLKQLPGEKCSYKSIDTVLYPDEAVNYPVEFLNSLTPFGLPPHHLKLKIGAPVMHLRNVEPPKLCNGTHLIIKKMMPRVLEATILTGKTSGEDLFIPRIPLVPSDTTRHKDVVGLNLKEPV
ncbi:uncharacterized protein [Macrobrachium rosenbergii]|uniref:uncharacterized protein n=1 Tax=Macrobrachium rosenbergii TaxID=79674 RepID=UPI0034D4DAF7